MAIDSRRSAALTLKELGFTGAGPFEAVVVSHLDPTNMGGLKVDLLKKNKAGAEPERVGTTIDVSYLSPFYGVTNLKHATANPGYADSQKSYGMWFVPPDSGSRVLVIFAEGDISRGYWIGCIQDQYMNFMVPDGRASTELTANDTPADLQGKKLPTGEYNKKVIKSGGNDPTQYAKPYNPEFVDSLETQGLLDDETRGTTSSSARRETPSTVFGINTPGPIDKRPGAPKGEYGLSGFKANVFVNRLGGSSFVMDDGDDKLLRKGAPGETPPEYAYVEAGQRDGDKTRPHNELLRLRTRTGHQILMHNTEDLIYIGNARGTSWIELSSNGKIDIYANDSISVHTNQDLNFTADRDVNIEAGRNINMRAQGRNSGGNIQMESKADTNILAENDMKIDVGNQQDVTVAQNSFLTAGGGIHNKSAATIFNYADVNVETKAGANVNIESGAATNILASAVVAIDGSAVTMQAGAAGPAQQAQDATAIEEKLNSFQNTQVVASDLSTITVESIVKRMPSHEPWAQHENLNPSEFTPAKTDVTSASSLNDANLIATPDTFRKNTTTSQSSNSGGQSGTTAGNQSSGNGERPVTPTGNDNNTPPLPPGR